MRHWLYLMLPCFGLGLWGLLQAEGDPGAGPVREQASPAVASPGEGLGLC